MNGVKQQVEGSLSGMFRDGDYTRVVKTTLNYTIVKNVDAKNDFYVSLNNRNNAAPFGTVMKGQTAEIGNTNINNIDITVEHNRKTLSLNGVFVSWSSRIWT